MAGGAKAQEFLNADAPLGDDAFYRLVSCAAPPQGECGKPVVRWSKTELSIGITRMDSAYLGGKKKRAEAAIFRAIQEINKVGSSLHLTRKDDSPDIPVLFLDIPAGSTIQGS